MKISSQPGYYPGFSTLSQENYWDEATRTVVLNRVERIPPLRFFSLEESVLLKSILERVIPQDDRHLDRRIPVLNFIDERLFEKRFDGFIFEGMPEDDEAHRLGLQAVQKTAQNFYKKNFTDLSIREQEELLLCIRNDEPKNSELKWEGVSAAHYWALLVQDAISAYYSHPWAWDEIGFGGPAYPRGYMRLTDGDPEPWEKVEKRYDWQAPPECLSDSLDDEDDAVGNTGRPGQGGTH